MFNDTDLKSWITQAEHYFEIQGTHQNLHVQLTHISKEGTPIHWFQSLHKKIPNLTWKMLMTKLLKSYSRWKATNPFGILASLKQDS